MPWNVKMLIFITRGKGELEFIKIINRSQTYKIFYAWIFKINRMVNYKMNLIITNFIKHNFIYFNKMIKQVKLL